MKNKIRQDWLSSVRGDLLAGLVVALALIPEAIASPIIAAVDPKEGLYVTELGVAAGLLVLGEHEHDDPGTARKRHLDHHVERLIRTVATHPLLKGLPLTVVTVQVAGAQAGQALPGAPAATVAAVLLLR